MGGAAEHLHCERWLNSARAFFQKANVLLFRFADAAERSPETDADPVLRPLLRIFNPGVIERELCRCDGKLRVAVESFQTVWREEFLRVPIINLAGDTHAKAADVKIRNRTDPGFLGENAFPKTIDAFADASNGAEAGDDNASSIHIITLFVRPSR